MGGAFRASGTGVPPIVNPAQSVRREWEGMGGGGRPSRGSPKVTVEGFGCWGWVVWDVVVFNLIISQCMITVYDDHSV